MISNKTIYLDNATTTFPKPECVYAETMARFQQHGVSPSRGCYSLAREMSGDVASVREALARRFNVDFSAVVLTPSATFSLNQILAGLDYAFIRHVYVSPFEHNSVLRPLHRLQKLHGFSLSVLPFSGFDWDEAETRRMFSQHAPDLVALSHASNVFGNVLPVCDIFSLAKEYNAVTVLDCAQSAGLLDTNAKALHVDFAAFAGHKGLYGPSGIGGFVVNTERQLEPLILGGTGVRSEDMEPPTELPDRFESGSHNSLSIIGLDFALQWLEKTGQSALQARKRELTQRLREVLLYHEDEIRIVSDLSRENVGVVSCVFKSHASAEVGALLDEHGIAVRTGLHCAPLAHQHMKTAPDGTVRFSVGHFNSFEQFDVLSDCLNEMWTRE